MQALHTRDWNSEIAWISTYLPHQGTLQHFVHHNPLNALENHPFEEACQVAEGLYQGESFLDQPRYLNYLKVGKMMPTALRQELEDYLHGQALSLSAAEQDAYFKLLCAPPGLSKREIIQKELAHHPQPDLVQHLEHLIALLPVQDPPANPYVYPTYRESILEQQGVDIDDIINPLLSKFLSAYVDPGSSYWNSEYRSAGLWACFRENFKSAYVLENRWARQLHVALKRAEHASRTVDELLSSYCQRLDVPPQHQKQYLLAMALRLRGWAGLFNQLEHEPEQILDHTVYSLKEFILVKLVIEDVVCRHFEAKPCAQQLESHLAKRQEQARENHSSELLYLTLHFLKQQGLTHSIGSMSAPEKQQLISRLRFLMQKQRRMLYQNALERSYAQQCVQALLHPKHTSQPQGPAQHFQYITCIDDREESLRRYLEQVAPQCQTFGVAGHFGLNMRYKGFNDVRYRKLCPGVVQETFQVDQIECTPASPGLSQTYARLFHGYALHSRISLISYLLTISGVLSIFPFFLKVFFPKLDGQLRRSLWKRFFHRPQLKDQIFQEEGQAEGLSYEQAADKVYQQLKTIDLLTDFCDFVYVVGHGSSSINNPHEYAYNCGACGGGKGRANGRIFATLANTPQVRAILAQKYGLSIPTTTVFMGGYHDTCKDTVSWAEIPLSPAQQLRHADNVTRIQKALQLNAQERGKKFYNVSPELNAEAAFAKMNVRANDLTEARPEYNHATNSLCVIGRRSLTQQLFMDRRSFLCSYNPEHDDGSVLAAIMGAAVPVCAGINLEYYFSTVDNEVYGCGSKLNHNITNNYAVMSGFASDLRLGLSKQMVEIHDPQRILFVIESQPAIIEGIMAQNLQLKRLITHHWVKLVVFDTLQNRFFTYAKQGFVEMVIPEASPPHYPQSQAIAVTAQNLIPMAVLTEAYA
ncbi:MAG: putative inorganic carbon transporter subunit DabA [Candidatus Sericytochromatia bacterium]